jgi:O-antigen/teichoic acid export membrane protein
MIFRLFLSASAAQALGLGLGFLTHLSLAAFMDVPAYGLFNLLFSMAAMISLVAGFGFHASVQRLIVQTDKPAALIQFAQKITIVSALILSVLVFLCMALFYKQTIEPQIWLYGASFLMAVFLSLSRLQVGVLKAFQQGTRAICYETVLREALVLGFIWSAWAIGITLPHVWQITGLYALVLVILCLAGWQHIKAQGASASTPATKSEILDWLKISFPMMFMIALQTLLHRADILILGFMLPLEDVGIYGFGAKIAQGATIIFMAGTTVFAARAAELYHQGQHKELQKLYRQTQLFMAVGTGILAAALLLLIGPLLTFFDPAYAFSLTPFYILLAGYVLNACLGPSSYLMIMTKHEMPMLWITLAAVIMNFSLSLTLIPLMGISGAALATALCLNLRNLAGILIFAYDARHR